MNTWHINALAGLVDRTAMLALFLSDWLYAAAIALASETKADRYRVIRAVALSLLRARLPELQPLLEASAGRPAGIDAVTQIPKV